MFGFCQEVDEMAGQKVYKQQTHGVGDNRLSPGSN